MAAVTGFSPCGYLTAQLAAMWSAIQQIQLKVSIDVYTVFLSSANCLCCWILFDMILYSLLESSVQRLCHAYLHSTKQLHVGY